MDLSIEVVSDVAVVVLHGEQLDAGNAAVVRRKMAPVVAEHTNVVLDMGELSFVDSSGLGAILSFTRQLASKGGELKLCNLQKPVRALVQLVRLHRVLDILNTRDEAVAAF